MTKQVCIFNYKVSLVSPRTYTLTCEDLGGGATELVDNGAFAGSTSQWTKTGDFYANDDFDSCRSCPGYAYLVGSAFTLPSSNNLEGELHQNISIPSDATSVSLEYWVSVSTEETSSSTSYDVVSVWIKNSSGSSTLELVDTHSNLDGGNGYQRTTFDLGGYAGQTVRLLFYGTTDSSNGTVFRIDDVSIEAVVPNAYSDTTVTVIDPPSPTLSFDVNPDTVNAGENSQLTWSTMNVDDCDASGAPDWNGPKSANGTQPVTPADTTTYTLTCDGNGDTVSDTRTVVVVHPSPTISISASPSSIDYGGSSTIYWSTTNSSSCTALGAWSTDGSKPTSGSQSVSPEISSVYGLSCSGIGGSVEASTTIIVGPPLAPEMDIKGNGVSITDGDNTPALADHTHFGEVETDSSSLVRTLYILNTGTQSLSLSGTPLVSVSGTDAADYSVTLLPSSSVLPGGQTAFQVTFDPSSDGEKHAELSIANNDANENPYRFSIQGTGNTEQPNPTPGTVQYSSASYSANEAAGTITVTVTRENGSDGAASVSYSTANDSAVAGSDYTSNSGTLNWADGGSGTKSFTVSIANDTAVEGNEVFNINLSGATGASLGSPSSTTVTILDDEVAQPGTVQLGAVTYNVNEDGGSVSVTVTRSNGSDGAASVSYSTADDSAVADSDYMSKTGTLNWSDGDSDTKSFTVSIANDAAVEEDEDFTVNLSSATGASLGSLSSTTVTILDDDQPFTSCSGTDVDLDGISFGPGTYDCIASLSLSAGSTAIFNGAHVLFKLGYPLRWRNRYILIL